MDMHLMYAGACAFILQRALFACGVEKIKTDNSKQENKLTTQFRKWDY